MTIRGKESEKVRSNQDWVPPNVRRQRHEEANLAEWGKVVRLFLSCAEAHMDKYHLLRGEIRGNKNRDTTNFELYLKESQMRNHKNIARGMEEALKGLVTYFHLGNHLEKAAVLTKEHLTKEQAKELICLDAKVQPSDIPMRDVLFEQLISYARNQEIEDTI